MKKALAIILVILIIGGWVISLTDIGPSYKDKIKLGLDFKGGVYVVMEAQTDATGPELAKLMEQTQVIIEDRVNRMGLSEPVVTIEGENKIRIELPGADNSDEAIKTIGKTAQLQFVLGDGTVVVDGSHVKEAGVGKDEKGFNAVNLEFDSEGSVAFEEGTRKAFNSEVINSETGQVDPCIYILLDGTVISSPGVNSVISGGKAQITGKFTDEEMTELALLIRGGALPVGLKEVQTSVVGPNLGIDSLDMSVIAGVIGVGLILIFMLVMYWVMGIIADIALLLYIMIVFWVFAIFSAVLNLPGIAGFILSIGMAVDANVIIFARIKEEYRNGKSLRVSVDSGFKRAMSTIIDSQLTTLIAGIVLYQFGTGPVKGFAMTLMIGIVVSVLTAVFVTQFLLKTLSESKALGKPKYFSFELKKFNFNKEFSFIKYRKYFYILAVALIIIGIGSGLIRGFNYGIDFTGGTMLQLDMGKTVSVGEVQDVLQSNDIDATVVHAGENNNEVIIKTTQALDNADRQKLLKDFNKKFGIDQNDVLAAEQFSASVGDLLKSNAIKAVIIATICMLIYIIIRFEWKFGVAAIISLIHDVLIVIAFYGLFRIPINNPFIAGILIVVGYSINDTIVVFDRIRENLKLMKKKHLEELIDKSINQTLIRSLMTSITTTIAIIPLFVLGGSTIRDFTLPLIIGIIAGAVSSITIASPLYYQIDKLVNKPKYRGK
ncbi:MAG: protein translocase subunit SecD [Anaerovoracaceae bacterium]